MSYTKAYTNKPTWHNDSAPAINETRLNDISGALDTIDDRVIAVDNKALKDVSDVNVSNLQNNQGLKWDSTSQKWVNGVVGGAVDITYANWLAQKQAGTIDNDLFYNITDYNELAGNLTPISYAEYNALTDAQKNDGTARFVYDYPLSNTYLDDTSTSSTTRGWSANKLNSEITSINNKFGNIIHEEKEGTWATYKADYIVVGKICVFNTTCVPKLDISSSAGIENLNMPIPKTQIIYFNAFEYDSANFANIKCEISNDNVRFFGSMTKDKVYISSGCYITT